MTHSLVGIGLLDAITFRDDANAVRTFAEPGMMLAWLGSNHRGTLVGLRPDGVTTVTCLSAAAREAHERFHGYAPTRAIAGISAGTPKQRLGRVVSVQYSIPKAITSNKSGDAWEHKIGDFGRMGKGDRSHQSRYWPELWLDAAGIPRLVRVPGNAYYLGEWLYG